MGMRINTNIEAFNAQRNLGVTSAVFAKSVEKLSSGMRINRAGDDAAGLSISEKLRAQVKGLAQAQRNAQDGISMIQTAEGALNEVHSMLQRMRELSVQAANDTLSTSDRTAIASELTQLRTEIDSIQTRTKFNGQALLTGNLSTTLSTASGITVGEGSGTFTVSAVNLTGASPSATYTLTVCNNTGELSFTNGSLTQTISASAVTAGGSTTLDFTELGVRISVSSSTTLTSGGVTAALAARGSTLVTNSTQGAANFQIGSDANQSVSVAFSEVGSASTSLNIATAVSTYSAGTTSANANSLITALDSAIEYVSSTRSTLGAVQNRLEHTINNLGVAQENLAASESRIRDVDMAAEMVNFTKTQILQQAGTAILAQANQAPQGVLSLLR